MTSQPNIGPLLNVGLYSFADAARFIGAESRELRRWLLGYKARDATGEVRQHKSVVASELSDSMPDAVSFRDLIELRFVHAFRRHGVSMYAIREGARVARELFSADHPFTCRRFQTDGRSIFVTIYESTNDETLLDLAKRQYAFREVVANSLYDGIEFDSRSGALRWYPLTRSKAVVLDPRVRFGAPIVASYGIPTVALADAVEAEGPISTKTVARVARYFDVPPTAVQAAIRFEKKIHQHS